MGLRTALLLLLTATATARHRQLLEDESEVGTASGLLGNAGGGGFFSQLMGMREERMAENTDVAEGETTSSGLLGMMGDGGLMQGHMKRKGGGGLFSGMFGGTETATTGDVGEAIETATGDVDTDLPTGGGGGAISAGVLPSGGGGGAISAGVSASEEEAELSDSTLSIASVVAATPELSILGEAAAAAGGDVLAAASDTATVATVFAPTDQAFADLLTNLGIDKETLLSNSTLLEAVLSYHIVTGERLEAADLTDGDVDTLLGLPLTISTEDGVTVTGVGSSATVIQPDVDAGESIVHVIDQVLLPVDLEA